MVDAAGSTNFRCSKTKMSKMKALAPVGVFFAEGRKQDVHGGMMYDSIG